MSCSSCHQTPCSCLSCDASKEPLSSALNNFITEFFGTITKECVNDEVVWTLPCNLSIGNASFPRNAGESLACYFLRYIQAQVVVTQGIGVYGSFFFTKPPDNAANIAPGSAIPFPNDGPMLGGLFRASTSSFFLPAAGDYEVFWHASYTTTNPAISGQVVLRVNGVELTDTCSRQRSTFIITTTVDNSIAELINPSANAESLVISSNTGAGNVPESGWITFKKL